MLTDLYKNFQREYEDDGNAIFISKETYALDTEMDDFDFYFNYKYGIEVIDINLMSGEETNEVYIELRIFPTLKYIYDKRDLENDFDVLSYGHGATIISDCIEGNRDYYPTDNKKVIEILNRISNDLQDVNDNLDNYLYRKANAFKTNLESIRETVTGEVRY